MTVTSKHSRYSSKCGNWGNTRSERTGTCSSSKYYFLYCLFVSRYKKFTALLVYREIIYKLSWAELFLVYFPAPHYNKNHNKTLKQRLSNQCRVGNGRGLERGTMFSQLAKRSTRMLVSGSFKQLRIFGFVPGMFSSSQAVRAHVSRKGKRLINVNKFY